MVLTFAMSLAVTSSIIWWTLRPLIAANMPRIMGIASLPAAVLPQARSSPLRPVCRWWLVDDCAVDVGEDAVAHLIRAHCCDDGAVPHRDDEGGAVDQDERLAGALGGRPADTVLEAA